MDELIVRIRYFNVLANYAGTKRSEVHIPAGTTVRGLFKRIAESSTDVFRGAIVHGDVISSHIRVFRNDKLIAADEFDSAVTDGDEFLLFPAVAGGNGRP